VDDAFGRDIDNEEREGRTKPYVISLQKVARPHGVVSQECSPALSAAWRWRPHSSHISLNRSLRYANAELEQLATNALGSPQAVVGRHALDEDSDVRSEARLAHVTISCWRSNVFSATNSLFDRATSRTNPVTIGLGRVAARITDARRLTVPLKATRTRRPMTSSTDPSSPTHAALQVLLVPNS
jgi:hypothetical protein